MKILTAVIMMTGLGFNLSAQQFGEFNSNDAIAMPVPLMEVDRSASGSGDRAVQREWTVMVFLNAKNNLESAGISDFNEMERVGSSSQVNVVVEMGRMNGYDASNGDWKGVRRFLVLNDLFKDPFGTTINSPMLENLGAVNMGDYKEVIKFVNWAKTRYPAKKYMLVLWNHGGGWTKDNPVADKGISYDEVTGNNIDTPQLGKIVKDVGGVDILASDACLMQMAEIVYEVKDNVGYVVGSEETEPNSGYSYHKILFPLASMPNMDPATLVKILVLSYWDTNAIGKHVATHSAIKASEGAMLGAKMDSFAKAAMASNDKASLKAARDEAQKYEIDDNKDLKHFLTLVASKTSDAKLKAEANSLAAFISSRLVIENKSSLIPASNSNGIAVYLPKSFVDGDYAEIKLARETQWDEFLKWLVK